MTARGTLLAFAVLGPPLAWATQLVGGYAVEEAACSTAGAGPPVLSVDAQPLLWGISAVAVAVAGLAGITGLVTWMRVRAAADAPHRDRAALLAGAGALAALVFLEAIALSAIAFLPFDPCTPA